MLSGMFTKRIAGEWQLSLRMFSIGLEFISSLRDEHHYTYEGKLSYWRNWLYYSWIGPDDECFFDYREEEDCRCVLNLNILFFSFTFHLGYFYGDCKWIGG